MEFPLPSNEWRDRKQLGGSLEEELRLHRHDSLNERRARRRQRSRSGSADNVSAACRLWNYTKSGKLALDSSVVSLEMLAQAGIGAVTMRAVRGAPKDEAEATNWFGTGAAMVVTRVIAGRMRGLEQRLKPRYPYPRGPTVRPRGTSYLRTPAFRACARRVTRVRRAVAQKPGDRFEYGEEHALRQDRNVCPPVAVLGHQQRDLRQW